jgi:hypothetical protein
MFTICSFNSPDLDGYQGTRENKNVPEIFFREGILANENLLIDRGGPDLPMNLVGGEGLERRRGMGRREAVVDLTEEDDGEQATQSRGGESR